MRAASRSSTHIETDASVRRAGLEELAPEAVAGKDVDRARAFYEGRLRSKPGGVHPDGEFVYVVRGSTLALFPKPDGTQADPQTISFRLADIAASVDELKRAGEVFEDADSPGLKTVNHVGLLGAEKAAWLEDTERNCLRIHEDIAAAQGAQDAGEHLGRAALVAPADVPEMPSTRSQGSSSSRSGTPRGKAPCAPPPCSPSSMDTVLRRTAGALRWAFLSRRTMSASIGPDALRHRAPTRQTMSRQLRLRLRSRRTHCGCFA